jgi:Acetyltransferase (isoleucine patch superfamily)
LKSLVLKYYTLKKSRAASKYVDNARKTQSLPILIHPKSVITKGNGARLYVEETLKIGTEFGFGSTPGKDITIVNVNDGAVLDIKGVVNFAPGVRVKVLPGAKLVVGGDTHISGFSKIFAFREVTIGKNCLISWDVTIVDSDIHHLAHQQYNAGKICIEDNVWIGHGVSILKNVTIGEGSVIGAKSVVTKSIPPRSLAVGNPARVIKSNIEWHP